MHTPKKTANYENLVRLCCANAVSRPFHGALAVDIVVVLPVPQSWPKKRRSEALIGSVHPTKRPDADNYLKAALDGMNGIAFADDAQVVRANIVKRYGEDARMMVRVSQIGEAA